ncbi:hypothetical protein TWF694_005653 [Orbilia ellipsospora]|uniref:Uncharacterized protein n=1 Tax=Orbilia ellipsospora TaxID=2528407 RepID=A0AAV9WSN3_9PEZI
MKFLSTIIVAIFSVTAMAAPTPDEGLTLEKRGCPAGTICIDSQCYWWDCNVSGCYIGAPLGQGC